MANVFGEIVQEEECRNLNEGDANGAESYEGLRTVPVHQDKQSQTQDSTCVEEELTVKQIKETMRAFAPRFFVDDLVHDRGE